MSARQEAAITGQKYYHGKPCKKCGETKRHTISASCLKCSNDRSREYAKARRELLKELLNQSTVEG